MTPKKKILVVEDEPVTRQTIEAGLCAAFDVVSVGGGREALDRVGSEDVPDLILLDVKMPGMDGIEVCRRLKAQRRTRHIPVIFITCLDDTISEARGMYAGAADYITKPVSLPALLTRIKTQLLLQEYIVASNAGYASVAAFRAAGA